VSSPFNGLLLASLLLVLLPAWGQDVARQQGDIHFRAQQYDDAITEYKRFLYFNADSPEASAVSYRIGVAYLRQRHFEAAYTAFRQSQERARTPEEHNQRCIETAIECLAHASYFAAEKNLTRVTVLGPTTPFFPRASFLLGVCHLYTGRWAEAQQALNHYAESLDASHRARIATLLTSPPAQKSPELAVRLSTAVPGLGQWYAGDRKNAVNAFAVNLLFGGNLVNAVLTGGDVVTLDLALSFFIRYYKGNRYHAARLVREFNSAAQMRYTHARLRELETLIPQEGDALSKPSTAPEAIPSPRHPAIP
jgi:tetratricopeptide (TPR) repeat protein